MNTRTPRFSEDLEGQRALALLIGAIALVTMWRVWVIARSNMTLYVDEAYYWGWAQALDWGYFSKPPLIAALIAATTALFGDGLLGVKAGSLLLYPATAVLLFAMGRRLYDTTTGLLAGLAFLTLPITSALGLFISTDAPLLFFWTAALWSLHRAIADDNPRDWLLLGLFCGLGLMSKYTMAAFALSALVLLLGSAEGRSRLRAPGPWVAALIALAILAPNLWWNWQHDFPTFRHTAEITQERESGGNPLEFIAAQIGSIGPLLAIGLIGALAGLRSAWRNPSDRLMIAGCLPLLLLVFAQSLTKQANANWAGPIFCSGTLLAVAWLRRTAGRRRLLAAALVLNLLITATVYHWPSVLALAGRPLTAKLDPLKRMKGWNRLVEGLRPFMLEHPDAYIVSDERKLLAHVGYTLRDLNPRIASWNPQGQILDQYHLTHSLPNTPGINIFFICECEPNGVAARFASAEQIARIRTTTHPDSSLNMDVWFMQGFKGY
ncbi:MAG: glycosyltransferase family 39 protein [Betaproteobacteria bacterium]|nr:glycosyltransferase family 39 protein [Betaproteobacteria bacterium]